MANLYLEVDSGTKVVVTTMEIEVMVTPTMGVTEAMVTEDTWATVEVVSKAGMDNMAGKEVVMDRLYVIDATNPGM